MAWFFLLLAGLCEIGWAVGLKFTEGFTRFWPSVVTVFLMVISFVLLGAALRQLPIGTAYAVWTGIGAAGTAIIGMIFLNESAAPGRVACIALIVAGVIGLKLLSPR